jgi:Archaeal/vacuolar-type H+-ATPase subunit E
MSLDTVVTDITAEAEAEADSIRSSATAEAEEIVDAARAAAADTLAEAESSVEATIEREREQAIASAKLEAKQLRLGARREVLADVRSATETALAEMEGERRERLTRALVDAGVAAFDSEELTIRGRPTDAELLSSIADADATLTVGEPLECLGGVIVESAGADVRVNNTFDTILDQMWDREVSTVSDELFDI